MLVHANQQLRPPVFFMVRDFAIRLASQYIVYECWSSTVVPMSIKAAASIRYAYPSFSFLIE